MKNNGNFADLIQFYRKLTPLQQKELTSTEVVQLYIGEKMVVKKRPTKAVVKIKWCKCEVPELVKDSFYFSSIVPHCEKCKLPIKQNKNDKERIIIDTTK